MDSIEKAIRNAFEKGDPENREFREKVYRAAFAALDRALKSNPNMTVEVAINRRKALQATITEIESEFIPAAPAVPPVASDNSLAPEISLNGNATRAAPTVSISPAGEARARGVTPVVPDIMPDGPMPPPVAVKEKRSRAERRAADRAARRAERRSPFAAMFFVVTLLTMGGIGAWWAVQTGLFRSPEEIDTSVRNPPKTLESEDFSPTAVGSGPARPGEVDAGRNWITVFSPSDPSDVSAPSGTVAEVSKDDTGSFLRIRSGDSGSAVSFDVGKGVLEQIAGKHAVFDIIARAEDGKETQMAVACNFGELGDCGRKRYLVGYQRGEYLFEMDVPDKDPGAAGSIAINADIDNDGKSVDIYEIRVSVTE
ncbi:hypothetical protein [Aminobacter sp. HY435]|uniref:hypothetical protein n=1 Tax=Aminobacter sp. HY435 TaxID=2970917 RepID=UPI0022B9B0BD|nr:hypothetical protein [Aminobacter sp. HY435]